MTQESGTAGNAGSAGTPGAGTAGTPSAGAPNAGAGDASATWTAGLDQETTAWVQNKGFKSISDSLTSHRNLEKLMGAPADRLLKLPGANEDVDAAMSSIYDRLGRPKTWEEYGLKDGQGELSDFAKAAAPVLHKLGLTAKQAQGLNEWWNGYADQLLKGEETQQADAVKADGEKLKTTWGQAYEQNVNMAKQAAQGLGVDAAMIDKLQEAMGFAKVMEFFHGIGTKIGEGQFVSSAAPGGGALSPAQAKAEIDLLKKDLNFGKKLREGDAEAMQRWQKLNQALAGTGTYDPNANPFGVTIR